MARLRLHNIDSRPFFSAQFTARLSPLRRRGAVEAPLSNNYDIAARADNVPSGFNMTETLVERISERFTTSCGLTMAAERTMRDKHPADY